MDATEKAILMSAVSLAVGMLINLEGYEPKPYYDIAGVLTECYGNTKGVDVNKPKTREQCDEILYAEAFRIGSMMLKDYSKHNVETLASGISFVYNIGDGSYLKSTYRRKLKGNNLTSACYEMEKWVYYTDEGVKKVSTGLSNRRGTEVEVCLSGL